MCPELVFSAHRESGLLGQSGSAVFQLRGRLSVAALINFFFSSLAVTLSHITQLVLSHNKLTSKCPPGLGLCCRQLSSSQKLACWFVVLMSQLRGPD